jgi:hypothetical protein
MIFPPFKLNISRHPGDFKEAMEGQRDCDDILKNLCHPMTGKVGENKKSPLLAGLPEFWMS